MSTVPQAGVEIGVRNLHVMDFLIKRCKWCAKEIFDSSTKPRIFCNNNNVCCNAYSRHKRNRDRSLGFDGRYEGPVNGVSKKRRVGKDRVATPVTMKNSNEPEHTSLGYERVPVPEPTPLITGWELGAVEHKARRKTGRLAFANL